MDVARSQPTLLFKSFFILHSSFFTLCLALAQLSSSKDNPTFDLSLAARAASRE
jgi:preprotein translocase subunit SecG